MGSCISQNNKNSIVSNQKINGFKRAESNRAQLFSTNFRHQSFPFRDSLINYITKNPSSPKQYQKLICSCKYFFINNPILVISDLHYSRYPPYRWQTIVNDKKQNMDVANILCKFWITGNINVFPLTIEKPSNLLSSIISRIYRCDAISLFIANQELTFDELVILASNVEDLTLKNVIIKYFDGSCLAIERIVEACPKVIKINFVLPLTTPNISSQSFEELLKIPHFLSLKSFTLWNIPQCFDIESFYYYMKKNRKTKLWLKFIDPLSESYKNQLEEILDEIITDEVQAFQPPYFSIPSIDSDKYNKMVDKVLKA